MTELYGTGVNYQNLHYHEHFLSSIADLNCIFVLFRTRLCFYVKKSSYNVLPGCNPYELFMESQGLCSIVYANLMRGSVHSIYNGEL